MNAPGSAERTPRQSRAERFRLVVVSAGASDPSSTRLLADRTAERAVRLAAGHGRTVTVSSSTCARSPPTSPPRWSPS